jgi:hypothetical protein
LIFDVIHFIICMGCLLHDFGWEQEWVESPQKLEGFWFDLDTIIRVDCVIEQPYGTG